MIALAFSGGKDSMACLHMMRGRLDIAIYVDTGFAYPETLAMVDYARDILPVHVVKTDRAVQNLREGIPGDVVPIDWTGLGQEITGLKDTRVQSYLGCCFQNISAPIIAAAHQLGVKTLVYGQRTEEKHKSPARDGCAIGGITRLHPIEGWTRDDVLSYLATKMDVPEHYRSIEHSSLDCYDCTAYAKHSRDRIRWMGTAYPEYHAVYAQRAKALNDALREALHTGDT